MLTGFLAMVPDYAVDVPMPSAGGPAPIVVAVLLAAAGVTLAAAVISLALHRDRRQGGGAFRTLSRAMGVRFDQRLLISRVARSSGRLHPGSLLISRGCFDEAVRGYVERFGEAGRLREIRTRVFREEDGA